MDQIIFRIKDQVQSDKDNHFMIHLKEEKKFKDHRSKKFIKAIIIKEWIKMKIEMEI